MNLTTEKYADQLDRWPQTGRHIMAQFDDSSIVVYQAYKPSIGHFAARNGYFGGDFQFGRMSWIKPNFLWMMYRSGWGTKPDQEVILAVRITREGFDSMLASAVHSSYVSDVYPTEQAWKSALVYSEVRLQWDPDHNPAGGKVERRAIQLGLRGEVLARYAREWVVEIEDISGFVATQHEYVRTGNYEALETPREEVYPIANGMVAARLQIRTDGV